MKTVIKVILLIVLACLSSIFIFYNVEKAKPVKTTPDILLTQNEIELSLLGDTNYTYQSPKIVVNPYGISPLTAFIIFETKDLTAPTVTIVGKDESTTYTHTFKPSKKHILPIYGLYADTNNTILLKVNGDTTTLQIKTEKLPDDFILPTNVTKESGKITNELYFVTPSSVGYTAAYDTNGDVRWYFTEPFIWDIKRLDNGNLLLSSNRLINPPYYMTGLMEMDLTGKVYFEYTMEGGYHHDVFEMENGNFLVASNCFKDGTVEDYIVELDRSNGNVVRTFDLKDILPMDEGKSESWTDYDWFHNNSVWYDKKTNAITLSGRHQDAVINIDYDSGELNWIIGDSTNWSNAMKKYFFTPIGDNFEWQWSQHAAMVLPNGDIFLFDNGNNRSKNKDTYIDANDNYSRGVIYHIDTEHMTIEQVWQYGKERGSAYYSPYISDVDYLSDNHYLIISGGHSEVDGNVNNNPASFNNASSLKSFITEIEDNQVIFELELPSNFYRTEKMSLYNDNDYKIGSGSRLGDMGITPYQVKYPILLFNKNITKEYNPYHFDLVKEVDRLSITGTYKKGDKVEIILDGTLNKKVYQVVVSKKPYTAMCVDIFNEKEEKEGIKVTKYINDKGLSGKYYIFIKVNGIIYDLDQYIIFKDSK